MKKTVMNFFVIFVVLFLSPFEVQARDFVSGAAQQGNVASVTFANLGYSESELVGPYDVTRKSFSVPSNWRLLPDGFVELQFDVIFSGADIAMIGTEGNTSAGLLTLSYNNQIIGNIPLSKMGSQVQRFQIPAEAMQSLREDNQHELAVQLVAQYDCLYDIHTIVLVKSASYFNLPFEITTPELDLRRLPAPFYLDNSLLPDQTLLVIPDSPEALELQAALNVSAGFGSMVGRAFNFQTVALGQLTNDMLALANIIFVGTPDDFPLIQGLPFPSPVSNGQLQGLPAQAKDDGVVELALSPWNSGKIVMLISGNSAEAVLKAATAVSSGKIFVYQSPTVVYVSDVQDLNAALPFVEDIKLEDLGYENSTLSGIGLEEKEYSFYVSKEQIETKEGQITLAYYHSGLMDYGLSSLSVRLNDEVITSQPFDEATEQFTYLPIKIPPGLLRFGENRLVVSAAMEPDLSCDLSGFSEPWITISNQTSIHLPAAEGSKDFQPDLLDLKYYPTMFTTHSDLGNLAFVLSENDPTGWKIAGELAFNLGESANPVIPNIAVAYAGNVPQSMLIDYSLIILGKPNALPLLTEINESLPAPFDFETNTANEKQMQIVYRLPDGVNVGYLELLASPYNPNTTILVASGNTDEGVVMAGTALINEQLKDKLAGWFAVTNGSQVAVSSNSSSFSITGTFVPSSSLVVTTPLPSTGLDQIQSDSKFVQPVWLLPVLIVSGVIVLLVILFVVFRSTSKDTSPKLDESDEMKQESTDKE